MVSIVLVNYTLKETSIDHSAPLSRDSGGKDLRWSLSYCRWMWRTRSFLRNMIVKYVYVHFCLIIRERNVSFIWQYYSPALFPTSLSFSYYESDKSAIAQICCGSWSYILGLRKLLLMPTQWGILVFCYVLYTCYTLVRLSLSEIAHWNLVR